MTDHCRAKTGRFCPKHLTTCCDGVSELSFISGHELSDASQDLIDFMWAEWSRIDQCPFIIR